MDFSKRLWASNFRISHNQNMYIRLCKSCTPPPPPPRKVLIYYWLSVQTVVGASKKKVGIHVEFPHQIDVIMMPLQRLFLNRMTSIFQKSSSKYGLETRGAKMPTFEGNLLEQACNMKVVSHFGHW